MSLDETIVEEAKGMGYYLSQNEKDFAVLAWANRKIENKFEEHDQRMYWEGSIQPILGLVNLPTCISCYSAFGSYQECEETMKTMLLDWIICLPKFGDKLPQVKSAI